MRYVTPSVPSLALVLASGEERLAAERLSEVPAMPE